ncbi:MAG: hypothetical protein RLY31_290 [Bacteroidota bacterium]
MKLDMKTSIITTVLAGILLLSACKEEESTIARIKGTVTVDNIQVWETWRDSGEVQLTLFPAFNLDPLAGWGAVPDNFFGPGVPGGTFAVGAPYNSQNPLILTLVPGQTAYDFELEVEPGTYSALALGFRHTFVNDPSLKTATLGVHWDNPDDVSHGIVIKVDAGGTIIPVFNYPAPVTFDVAEGETKEINFKADFAFVNTWYQ